MNPDDRSPGDSPGRNDLSVDDTVAQVGPSAPTAGYSPSVDPIALTRGALVGRYMILNFLGGGGMGVVYSAYDPKLDRKVALKLLRADLIPRLGGEAAKSRLLREAQAMARLSHPNVITVHDVGTIGEQIFVAMEFVDGATLRGWLREERADWRRIVDIYARAGRGLAAAHAAGLIHRDFKPDNVLVRRDGAVRVLDFGLAREAGDSQVDGEAPLEESDDVVRTGELSKQLTEPGAIMGTPAYMAPEQHQRRPTEARSDQFSFCVALYEALYRELPFSGRTRIEVGKAATRGDVRPAPPDTRVPNRLRRVLLRGLSPDPADRYPSMNALLRDLQRESWIRRRSTMLVAAVAVIGVAAALLVNWAHTRSALICKGAERKLTGTWDPQLAASVRSAFMATKAPYASVAFDATRRSLNRYAAQWVAAHIEACEATRVRGEQSEQLLDLRMSCLERRRRELAALVRLFSRADAKVVQKAVSVVSELSDLRACADATTLRAVVPPPKDDEVRRQVRAVRTQLADAKALHDAGKYPASLDAAKKATASARKIGYRPLNGEALYELGRTQARLGRWKAAHKALVESWAAAHESRDDRLAIRGAVVLIIADSFMRRVSVGSDHWGGIAAATIARIGGDARLQAKMFDARGWVLNRKGRYGEAIDLHKRALALYRQIVGPRTIPVARAHNNIGIAMRRAGRFEEGLVHMRRAQEIGERVLGPAHPRVGIYVKNVAALLTDQGHYDVAVRHIRQALAIFERALGPDHPETASSHNNLGVNLVELGSYAKGIEHYTKALEIYQKAFGARSATTAVCWNNIGFAYLKSGQPEKALGPIARALDIWETRSGPGHPDVALALENLGWALRALKRYREALPYFEWALGIRLEVLGKKHPAIADSLLGIGQTRHDLGEPATAVQALERALKILRRTTRPAWELARVRFALARALTSADRREPKRARELAARALAGYRRSGKRFRKEQAEIRRWIAKEDKKKGSRAR